MSLRGLAKRLNLLPDTIFMLSKKGSLPCLQKVGNRWLFVKKEVEKSLGEKKSKPRREKNRLPWELSSEENRLIRKRSLQSRDIKNEKEVSIDGS